MYTCISVTDCKNRTYDLPSLGGASVCNLDGSCTAVDCCFQSDFLRRTLHAAFNVSFCDFEISGELEKAKFSFTIIDYEWGKLMLVKII